MRLRFRPPTALAWRQLPLRVSLLTTGLTLLLPALLLALFPRRLAVGLDRLLPEAALLQSFSARPAEPPPALWLQRLGPQDGQRLWSRQRRLWWQFWGPHGDAGSYLVIPDAQGEAVPAVAVRVDDLLVIAPNPLARQLLQEQLKLQRRPSRGLDRRCSTLLLQRTAVHWNGVAVAQMLGPLAPLATQLQQGCLVLSSEGNRLLWSGEADATADTITDAPAALSASGAAPLPAPQLLQLRGRRLELLQRGLTASALRRSALAERYGLGPEQLQRLQAAPFELQLRLEPRGPFRAGLLLLIDLPPDRRFWDRWLQDLARGLQRQGLERSQPLPGLSSWSRADGTVVGGWRWLARRRLLWFLGPVPRSVAASPALGDADWRLQLRPQALAGSGLLPPGLPLVVRRAQQLQLQGKGEAEGLAGQRQNALSGQLELRQPPP